jgi:serine/threonine protein kinase
VLYERTFREARASARLSDPGVVTVHDVVQEAGRPWIVMEFIRARSLQEIIDEDGTLPPDAAAGIGHQTLMALRHAHAAGVLHRDVKPSNVLVTAEGRAVLTDFGIAQAEGDTRLTRAGLVMGSPCYIPPSGCGVNLRCRPRTCGRSGPRSTPRSRAGRRQWAGWKDL